MNGVRSKSRTDFKPFLEGVATSHLELGGCLVVKR